MDESRTQARSGGVFGKESEGERNREERSMADYKEFLDSINREAYHAGEYQWEEDVYKRQLPAREAEERQIRGTCS